MKGHGLTCLCVECMAEMQQGLFRKPTLPPFARESETSRAAAVSMYPVVNAQAALVLGFIDGREKRGATSDEAEESLGVPHQSVSARVNWLKSQEPPWIVDSGQTRKTRSGRQATVWIGKRWADGRGNADDGRVPPDGGAGVVRAGDE